MPLSAESAAERLASIRNADWQRTMDRRVAKILRRKVRYVAAAFARPQPSYGQQSDYKAWKAARDSAAVALDELPDKQRAAVFAALLPGFAPALTRWWVDSQQQPYLRNWSRRAFRATNTPNLTRHNRADDLSGLIAMLGPYDSDPVWLSGWGGHLAQGDGRRQVVPIAVGGVLAAAIDQGGREGEETLRALIEVANGEHPVGIMGRHVVIALLRARRPDGWQYVENLLLTAQRQEGLRQVILEAADEGQPEAFDRILNLVVEHRLTRFASTVRAIGIWLGFGAEVSELPTAEQRLKQLIAYRQSGQEVSAGLASSDPWDVYIALCVLGMRDVASSVPRAAVLATSGPDDVRAAAVRYLASTYLISANRQLLEVIQDPNLAVAALAASLVDNDRLKEPGAFVRLASLVDRLPDKAKVVESLGVELGSVKISKQAVARRLIDARGERSYEDLAPWLPAMDANGRALVAGQISSGKSTTPEIRKLLLDMLNDRAPSVRQHALDALSHSQLTAAEAQGVEALLSRTATDIRRAALNLLAMQPPVRLQASIERLSSSSNKLQRQAGEELQSTADGSKGKSRRAQAGIQAGWSRPAALPAATGATEDLRTTMVSADRRSAPVAPSPQPAARGRGAPVAARIANELDRIAAENRDTPVVIASWQASKEMLFGDIRWLPTPFGHQVVTTDDDDETNGMLLRELVESWWESRPEADRTTDPLDALRVYVLAARVKPDFSGQRRPDDWWTEALDHAIPTGNLKLQFPSAVEHFAIWLVAMNADASVIDECLDATEAAFAAVPRKVLSARPEPVRIGGMVYGSRKNDWRARAESNPWLVVLNGLLRTRPALFSQEQIARWYGLARWLERPHDNLPHQHPDQALLLAAHDRGIATDDDVLSTVLAGADRRLLADLTKRWRSSFEQRHPKVIPLGDRLRDRLIEVELTRGDLPTATSRIAGWLAGMPGADRLVDVMAAIGKTPLMRGWVRDQDSRTAVFSRLVRVSYPGPDDTAKTLAAAAKRAGLSEKRLVEIAMYAPQWSELIEEVLAWPGLTDGVLWMHAHTKDEQWSVDLEVRQSWAALSAERTPLASQDLIAGAVDVDWFERSHKTLGEARWKSVYEAAKLASGGGGHKRAQTFADAMLGKVSEAELASRIRQKRNQDAVRAYGLVELPTKAADRAAAVGERYALLRGFERGSRQFGNQRQNSERTAVRVALENLARTAGYADPMRLMWAMEAREGGDLAEGPVVATHGDVKVTLSVDAEGSPDITIHRGEKTLQSVPAALRKAEDMAELRARKTALVRQASRVRQSLEGALVGGETFTMADLDGLRDHPILAPMINQLIWVDQDTHSWRRDGAVFVDAVGSKGKPKGALRLAHPVDLVGDKSWVAWQEQIFAAGRKQPFKQAFRELYVLTAAERKQGPASHRYDGHQIQPRQALALFGRRGWLTSHETGTSRVFHQYGLAARLDFLDGILTPLEADLPTLSGVYFTKRGEYLAQPLDSVPPIVFSETMRDVDLVVSVAHAGGIDPEASQSTTEMREALIRETARLLKLANISFSGDHAVIAGTLGEYSLHLGSGTVHRRPGGAVCIIPVSSQHRGRLFLPFADDDPKTAEIVAKALLLARDQEIKDPSILEQLRS
jgi:hypothetical protein